MCDEDERMDVTPDTMKVIGCSFFFTRNSPRLSVEGEMGRLKRPFKFWISFREVEQNVVRADLFVPAGRSSPLGPAFDHRRVFSP